MKNKRENTLYMEVKEKNCEAYSEKRVNGTRFSPIRSGASEDVRGEPDDV